MVVFSLAGSGFSRLTGLNPGPIAPITSLLTIGAGIWATFGEYVAATPHAWVRLFSALGLGAGAEIVGLATGFPFGRYAYTHAWWPTVELPVGPFPLALPFAWLLMAGAGTLVVKGWLNPHVRFGWRPALLGGLLAAIVDVEMEPVMAGPLGYWHWLTPGPLPGGAPVENFLGWWAVAAVAGLILISDKVTVRSAAPRWVLVGFVVLIVGLGVIGRV